MGYNVIYDCICGVRVGRAEVRVNTARYESMLPSVEYENPIT